jgi:hypothetical protein
MPATGTNPVRTLVIGVTDGMVLEDASLPERL